MRLHFNELHDLSGKLDNDIHNEPYFDNKDVIETYVVKKEV